MGNKRDDPRQFYVQTEYFDFWEKRLRDGYEEPHLVSFIRNLDLKKTDSVLEIGSGGGRILARIADSAARTVGVDLSRKALKAGVFKVRIPSNVDLVVADASALPFSNSSFDTAFSFSTLFFIKNQTAAIREGARVSQHLTIEVENRLSFDGILLSLQDMGLVAFSLIERTTGLRFATELAVLTLGKSRANRLLESIRTGLHHKSYPVWAWTPINRLRENSMKITAVEGTRNGVPWWLSSKIVISSKKTLGRVDN